MRTPHGEHISGPNIDGVGESPTDVTADAEASLRTRHLAGLLRLRLDETHALVAEGERHVFARLSQALLAERRRGVMGDWIYSLPRHRALIAAVRDARARLSENKTAIDVCRDHSSSRVLNVHAHSLGQPLDNHAVDPISPGTPPETDCSGFASDVSGI